MPRHARGMSLIEVLATMLIMAIVLPAATHAIRVSTSLAGLARQRNEALERGERKLDELRLNPNWQQEPMEGDFGPDAPEMLWQAELEDWEESGFALLRLHITWPNRNETRDLELSTLVKSGIESGGTP